MWGDQKIKKESIQKKEKGEAEEKEHRVVRKAFPY
jgi:hypothetical protein